MRFAVFLCAFIGCSSPRGGSDGGGADAADAQAESGPQSCGAMTCKSNETCVGGTFCACAVGFVTDGNHCNPATPGTPGAHTEMEVCAKWKSGHVLTTPKPFKAGAMACDPGTLDPGGITDVLVRLNMFRWMAGLFSDVTDDPAMDQDDQACAVIQANNPLSHMPPTNSVCWNPAGAAIAAQSNLAYGVSNADSIDLYIQDPGAGNAMSLGHRRWCLHPPLAVVGVGYFEGGTMGKAQCLGVFDTSGSGPMPLWYAWPPPGYAPIQVFSWTWSFHYTQMNVLGPDTTISVKNLATNADAPVTVTVLDPYYGDDAIAFAPKGWTPQVGEIYRVTVNAKKVAPITYDVIPVSCP